MKKVFLVLQLVAVICFSRQASAQNLITIAGNGQFSYGGDGAPALNSAENRPTGIWIDTAGNIYVADSYNNVVRKISAATGIIETYAGNGFGAGMGPGGGGGYTGDGGPATGAEMDGPQGIAMDHSGNLYIADAGNHVVRMVDTSGIISTFAGNGTSGNTGDGTPATAAELNTPAGLAFDDTGNLYICDHGANVIRKVRITGTTTIISTIAGTGTAGYNGDAIPAITAQLNNPWQIAVDTLENIYVCDLLNSRIRKISPAGIITTVVGTGTPGYAGDGGLATAATITGPVGIIVNRMGQLFFTDGAADEIRRVANDTITHVAGVPLANTYAGNGVPATSASLYGPNCITMDHSGNIYFSDNLNNLVRKVNPMDIITTISGTIDSFFCGDDGPALTAELDSPMAAAFDDTGNIYIADYGNNCIRIVHPSGSISTFAGDALAGPGYSGDGGPATSAKLNHPKGVAVDAAANVYISDAGNSCIRVVHPSGSITTYAGTPLSPGYSGDGGSATSAQIADPNGLAIDTAGNLYISDAANHRIRVVHPSGSITTYVGVGTSGSGGDGGSATDAQLTYPMGITIDNSGNLYIADSGAARVRVVHPSGSINTFAGTGVPGYSGDGGPATAAQFTSPMGVVVDDTGNVHITDGAAARIRIVHPSGSIDTYAGTGVPGFNGDGPVGTAEVNMPVGLSKDPGGRLYVTDRNNQRVRRFVGNGFPLAVTSVNKSVENLTVFPNPGRGNFYLSFTTSAPGQVHYTVTNLLGQKIKDLSANTGELTQMQLYAPAGIYLLTAETANGRTTTRIVVAP